MKIELYASWGVLGHEARPVFGEAPASEAYDKVLVEIPDEFKPYETESGSIALYLPNGYNPYMLTDVLNNDAMDGPVLEWIARDGAQKICRLKFEAPIK